MPITSGDEVMVLRLVVVALRAEGSETPLLAVCVHGIVGWSCVNSRRHQKVLLAVTISPPATPKAKLRAVPIK